MVHGGRLRDVHRGHGVDVETENLGSTESHHKALSEKSLNPSKQAWDRNVQTTVLRIQESVSLTNWCFMPVNFFKCVIIPVWEFNFKIHSFFIIREQLMIIFQHEQQQMLKLIKLPKSN